MSRTLWKLQQMGERLWTLAAMAAQTAGASGIDGRGFAIVAEEIRKLATKINDMVEQALFEDAAIDKHKISDIAWQLNLLALNNAIEAYRLCEKGKAAAVCAEEIRTLAYGIAKLFDKQPDAPYNVSPWPKNPLSTLNQTHCFLLFTIAGIPIKENLINVQEIIGASVESQDGRIKLRKKEFPVINASKIAGKPLENLCYVILRTPWAAQDQTYAVVADTINVNGIIATPIGTPVAPPADMPFAECVRECWENENGEPFYFMDWAAMQAKCR